MIEVDKLSKAVSVAISRAKLNILNESIELLKLRLHHALSYWKREVRMLLSVPYNGRKNTSLYPKRRKGDLLNSLHYRVLSTKVDDKKGKAILRAKIIWDNDPKGIGKDYGEILNSSMKYKDRKFFGWKNRTYRLLSKRLKRIYNA